MQVDLPKAGKYVVAVSGGVDSLVLLDVLRRDPGLELVVAHFDHGIRPESGDDAAFVQETAAQWKLTFVLGQGRLGLGASEAAARQARYAFLRRVRAEQGAAAILTAHHQNDVIETALINLVRGTGRKGLTALGNTKDIWRPFLEVPKPDILAYATQRKLQWREDKSNQDERYLRNYIRARLQHNDNNDLMKNLLVIIERLREVNQALDSLVAELLGQQLANNELPRDWFTCLPQDAALEVMAAWLRQNDERGFDQRMLERLVIAATVARPGKKFDVRQGLSLLVQRDYLALVGSER